MTTKKPRLKFDEEYPFITNGGFPFRMSIVRRYHLGYPTHDFEYSATKFIRKVKRSADRMIQEGMPPEKAISTALKTGKRWLKAYRITITDPQNIVPGLAAYYPAYASVIRSQAGKLSKII